ncbi:hypothetical protein DEDE109153_09070 [Deinococcus deserti]
MDAANHHKRTGCPGIPLLGIPPGLRTEEFIFRPLRITDAELDFDALTASREALLVFSGGRWPAGGFSLS